MKICLFDHSKTPYPVQGYGGIERINQYLYMALVDMRYDVTLVVVNCGFQYKEGKVIKLDANTIDDLRFGRKKLVDYLPNDFDIFQTQTSGKNQSFNFSDFHARWFATCQGDEEHALCPHQIFVSHNQLCINTPRYNIYENCENVYVCHSGISTEVLKFVPGEKTEIVWLGRIETSKGAHFLPLIAELSGEKISFAGNINDRGIFNRINSDKNLHYYGEIRTEEEKCIFFSTAKLYIHTAQFNDPFPTTILEAQMCGVPVMALNKGSMSESLFDKSLIFSTPEDMASAIRTKEYLKIKPGDVYRFNYENFSNLAMANRYLAVWNSSFIK